MSTLGEERKGRRPRPDSVFLAAVHCAHQLPHASTSSSSGFLFSFLLGLWVRSSDSRVLLDALFCSSDNHWVCCCGFCFCCCCCCSWMRWWEQNTHHSFIHQLLGGRLGWYSFVCSFLFVLFPFLWTTSSLFPCVVVDTPISHFLYALCSLWRPKSFQAVSFLFALLCFWKLFWVLILSDLLLLLLHFGAAASYSFCVYVKFGGTHRHRHRHNNFCRSEFWAVRECCVCVCFEASLCEEVGSSTILFCEEGKEPVWAKCWKLCFGVWDGMCRTWNAIFVSSILFLPRRTWKWMVMVIRIIILSRRSLFRGCRKTSRWSACWKCHTNAILVCGRCAGDGRRRWQILCSTGSGRRQAPPGIAFVWFKLCRKLQEAWTTGRKMPLRLLCMGSACMILSSALGSVCRWSRTFLKDCLSSVVSCRCTASWLCWEDGILRHGKRFAPLTSFLSRRKHGAVALICLASVPSSLAAWLVARFSSLEDTMITKQRSRRQTYTIWKQIGGRRFRTWARRETSAPALYWTGSSSSSVAMEQTRRDSSWAARTSSILLLGTGAEWTRCGQWAEETVWVAAMPSREGSFTPFRDSLSSATVRWEMPGASSTRWFPRRRECRCVPQPWTISCCSSWDPAAAKLSVEVWSTDLLLLLLLLKKRTTTTRKAAAFGRLSSSVRSSRESLKVPVPWRSDEIAAHFCTIE